MGGNLPPRFPGKWSCCLLNFCFSNTWTCGLLSGITAWILNNSSLCNLSDFGELNYTCCSILLPSYWLYIPTSGVILKLSHRPYPVLPLTRMTPVRWIYSCCCFVPAVIDANGASHHSDRAGEASTKADESLMIEQTNTRCIHSFGKMAAKCHRDRGRSVVKSKQGSVQRAQAAFDIPWRPLCGLGVCGCSPGAITGTQS